MLTARPTPSAHLLLCAAALGIAYAAGCARAPDSEGPSEPPAAPVAASAFIGDAACAECHADVAADFARTTHAGSISAFDPATAPERFAPDGTSPEVVHPRSGRVYQAFLRGDTLFQREYRRGASGAQIGERVVQASHVIGSGHATRSYLAVEEGSNGDVYLTEMPLTWYVDAERWDLSPGYDFSDSRFDRAINLECASCHVSGAAVVPHTQNRYTAVGGALGCESCHGGGAAHVAAHRRGEPPDSAADLVNPSRLSPDLELAVCQQCHLEGLTVLTPGETATSYQPGMPLRAHRAVFVPEEKLDHPEDFGLASHAYRLMQSACFEETLAAGGAMTCTTCHDPHRPTSELDLVQACQGCHGAGHETVCSRPDAHGREGEIDLAMASTGDCVSCHMTVGDTENIPHVTFTDHWIRRTPPATLSDHAAKVAAAAARTEPYALVEVLERQDELWGTPRGASSETALARAALEAGMAYYALYDGEHRLPEYLARTIAGVRRGIAAGQHRPDVYVALGRALRDADSLAAAGRAFGAGAARFPDHAGLAYWLGHTRLALGDAAGALTALDASVRAQPLFQEAHLKRGEALAELGRSREAVAAFRAGVELAPQRSATGWNNLGFELLKIGDTAGAKAALRHALDVDADFVTARVNLASALLVENDPQGAIPELERVLDRAPDEVAALGNLGVAYARTGRLADARQAFRRLLVISPRDRQARTYLAELDAAMAQGGTLLRPQAP